MALTGLLEVSVLVPAAAHLSRARMDSRNSGTKPWASSVCRVLAGFQRQQMPLFRAYQLRTWAMRTDQKNSVPVLTDLLTTPGNQSRKCLIPWKPAWKPRLGNTRRKSAVSLLQRLLQRLGNCAPGL